MVALILIGAALGCAPNLAKVPSEAEQPKRAPIKVAAKELFAAFAKDKAAAAEKYGNRPLAVEAVALGVDRDFIDMPVILLATGDRTISAEAVLTEASRAKAGTIKKFQPIVLHCASIVEIVDTMMLGNCRL